MLVNTIIYLLIYFCIKFVNKKKCWEIDSFEKLMTKNNQDCSKTHFLINYADGNAKVCARFQTKLNATDFLENYLLINHLSFYISLPTFYIFNSFFV